MERTLYMGNLKYVDLHIHSYYSDGTMSPLEIVDAARDNGVGLIAIADHDVIRGSAEAQELCRPLGIDFIQAVEIDTCESGLNFHILAYGFSFEDAEFAAYVDGVKRALYSGDDALMRAMEPDYSAISLSDFAAFERDVRQGGWKALNYLLDKGITRSIGEGIKFYGMYGISYGDRGYPTIGEVCRRVREAGGRAVLAHPGVTIDAGSAEEFGRELERIVDMGVDGIECHYPKHSPEVVKTCLELCRERGLLITAGSDCHGAFSSSEVGSGSITRDMITLGDLAAAK